MDYKENLNIDLSSPDRVEIPVQVEWKIDIPEPTGALKKFFFKRYGKLDKEVSVAITDINVDKNIKLNAPPEDLVFLRSAGECGSNLKMQLKNLKTYCQVMMNPKVIVDCLEQEKEFSKRQPYPVTFSVALLDQNDDKIEKHDITVLINFVQVHLDPKVTLSLEENFTYSSSAELVEIGSVNISNPTPDLKFTPAIDVDLSVDIRNGRDALPEDAIHVGSPSYGNRLQISGLVPHDPRSNKTLDKMVMPIFLDMRRLSNPLVPKETLDVVVNWSYHHSYNHSEYLTGDRALEQIEFSQDAQGAELIVSEMDGDNVKMRISNGQSITLPEISFYAESSTVLDRVFRLGNLATDRSRAGAGVKVANLLISEEITGAYLKDRKEQDVTELFDKSDSEIARLNSGFELRNGENSHIDFTLTFDPGKVLTARETKNFRFESILKVEFDYYENSTGKSYSEITPQHFSFEIRQPLYLLPNPHWLCIDYGSSAIVCKYNDKLIDLHARKNAILKKALNPKDRKTYLDGDTLEKGTPFLSSDIVFHNPINHDANKNVSSLCSEQVGSHDEHYDKLGVYLSPTSPMIINEVLRQLPCFKLLVGNKTLPQNPHYQKFTYDIADSAGGVQKVESEQMKESNPDKSLMVIDTVFCESYEALMRYFVIPEIQNVNLINRLVLTYPNTYTPRHLDTLRGIVKKTIPAVRELAFVSESDAVAAYYLENWSKYHEKNENPLTDENLLVYDMGAGTLDLSLIRKTASSDGKIKMEIVAKIGTPKAGNYLDFVLAQIVCSLMGDSGEGGMGLASTQTAANAEIGKERSALKNFVKNDLKPRLDKAHREDILTFKSEIGESYKSFTIGQVLDDPRLSDFLKEVTDDIIGQLARFAGSDHASVDIVLMSGRSSLFAPLRAALSHAIKVFNHNQGITKFIRLDEMKDGVSDPTRQKVAVTEGAMAIMARNYRMSNSLRQIIGKKIYASFGVAYQDLGKWHYVELLNYMDIPAGHEGEYNGKCITLPNLNNIPTLVVIQSYLDEEATVQALNDGKWDYLAEMERITLDGQSSESLMMKINRDNNVLLYLGQQRTRGQAPKSDDLTGEAIRRSLWPVSL